ncbi:MAG: M23 family metallopeptidase [Actinomycetota bacterium]|nr:M23 family metallopeptidase [Actinomycetota bacterium]
MHRPYDQQLDGHSRARGLVDSWDAPSVDGSLALEWSEPAGAAGRTARRLNETRRSDSVPAMAWPEAPGLAARAALREKQEARARRARRAFALAVLAAVALVVLLLTAFGPGEREIVGAAGPAPAQRLLPSGPPRPQVVAMRETLRILLPINQARVTAIGYHASGPTTLPLEPVGSQANAGVFRRLIQRLVGDGGSGLRYYLLEGGSGPQTGGLDVGAPAGTDVYAPVDGTVIAISDRIVDGRPYGKRVELQPAGNPGVVVALTNIEIDPALTVGSTVVAARTKVGQVIDVSSVERAGLARYTQDRGQHVHLETHAAASLATP